MKSLTEGHSNYTHHHHRECNCRKCFYRLTAQRQISTCPGCDREVQSKKLMVWESTGELLAVFQCNGPNDDEQEAIIWSKAVKP